MSVVNLKSSEIFLGFYFTELIELNSKIESFFYFFFYMGDINSLIELNYINSFDFSLLYSISIYLFYISLYTVYIL